MTVHAGTSRPLVLLHSPLVGASFWRPVQRILEHAGWRCRTPSAAAQTAAVPWRQWPSAVCDDLGAVEDAILVGHSAAGYLLPSVAHALDAGALVFVDALIPPACGHVAPADGEFLEFVRGLPIDDGVLPPWSRWWGEASIERLVGDAGTFATFESDLPRLPLSWFDDSVEVPEWSHLPAGYVQTSQRFAPTAADARGRGWPVRELAGTHLHPLLEPDTTATALLQVISCLGM